MKRRKLYISILLGLCLCLFTAFFTACKDETPAPTLESINVSGETEVFIDEFDYADYTITATYSDDSTKTATLTADNLSAEDNAKLSTVGTHALTVSYESVACSWTVTLKNHDFTGLTFEDITTTYDGTAKTLAVSGLPTGAQVSYDKETTYTNAGEYTVKATISLANYNPVELTATLTINKATYDMSAVVFADKTVTYNGESHSIETTNLPDGVTAQYTGNNQINADEYTVTATFTGDSANYEPIADKTATLTINKATYDMSGVRFENTEAIYDGQTHSVTVTGLPSGVSVSWENNGKVNADEYTVTAKFTGDRQNYEVIADKTTTLTIHKATITGITFTGVEYTYDGTAKSLAIAGTLPDGVTVSYTGNNQTNAGEYPVTATFTKNANYNDLSDMQATLKINKATYDMSSVVFKDKSVNYTGEAYSLEATNLPSGVSVSYVGNDQTQAGNYTVTAKFTGDSQNYEPIADKTATLTIEQRELTLAFSGETTLKYNGNAQKTLSVQATNLVNGDSVQLTVSYNGEMIEAGEYIATATLAAHQNYKLTANNTVKVTITRATHTVTFKQDGFAYITREVLDLADLTDIPTPQSVDGYTITWEETDFSCITKDMVVNAIVTLNTYYATFISENETLAVLSFTVEDSSINTPNCPEKTGYTVSWEEFTIQAKNMSINAIYTPIEYKLSYENCENLKNANPLTYTIESDTIILVAIEKDGYSFDGWYGDDNVKLTHINQGTVGDISLTAKWVLESYTITYILDGGENHIKNPSEYTILDTIELKESTNVKCSWGICG